MRAATLALAILLAGCVGAPSPGAQVEGIVDASSYDAIEASIGAPVIEEHDHGDPAEHASAHGLDLVAALTGEPGRTMNPTERIWQTAVKGDHAYMTRTGADQGLVVFDIADPLAPKQVGYLKLDAGFEPDIEVSDDGMWGFWETQRFPLSAPVPSLVDPGANAQRGVHIIDLSDKAAPRWVGYSPTWPDGPHSITYANVSGRHILLQSVYAFAYAYADQEVPQAQRLVVSELDTSLPVPTLRTLAEIRKPADPTRPGHYMPHDVSVSVHPVTGQTLAYVAWWDHGIVVYDLADPANPVEVGQSVDFGPASYRQIHMVRQFPHLIDGRVIAVAEPEIGGEPDSGYLTFHDVTDPAKPTYVSAWKLPGNLTSIGGSIGPHYFDVMDGRVALASYHAGFWVIDVHDAANLARPRSTGYALVNATGTPVPGPLGGAGASAFDAWWVKDAAGQAWVVGGDAYSGLNVFRYTGPAPPPE